MHTWKFLSVRDGLRMCISAGLLRRWGPDPYRGRY